MKTTPRLTAHGVIDTGGGAQPGPYAGDEGDLIGAADVLVDVLVVEVAEGFMGGFGGVGAGRWRRGLGEGLGDFGGAGDDGGDGVVVEDPAAWRGRAMFIAGGDDRRQARRGLSRSVSWTALANGMPANVSPTLKAWPSRL